MKSYTCVVSVGLKSELCTFLRGHYDHVTLKTTFTPWSLEPWMGNLTVECSSQKVIDVAHAFIAGWQANGGGR